MVLPTVSYERSGSVLFLWLPPQVTSVSWVSNFSGNWKSENVVETFTHVLLL